MRFAVLGPLLVHDGGRALDLVSPRQRALLAALLFRANQVISYDELAEFIWDGAPPGGARITMRSYVARLRKTLGPELGARIITRSPGYTIELAETELDLLEFEDRVRRAQRAERAGLWEPCADEAGAALALWRGPVLNDVPVPLLIANEEPRLKELRLRTLSSRIAADLRLDRHAEVIGELGELVAAHPMREHFVVQLMLAQFRSGRRAEALASYHDARRRLIDELGVEPGAELQMVHQLILDADPPPQAQPDGDAADPPDVQSVPPRQLPRRLRDFVGRGSELARISTLLIASHADRESSLVAITGLPGVGKTSLAVAAAHAAASDFPDGQLFIPLAGAGKAPRDPHVILQDVLETLGAPAGQVPASMHERAALYRSWLASKRMLILVDDAAGTAQVEPFLPGTGASALVVTSRRQNLHLYGATMIDLPPLGMEESTILLRRIVGERRCNSEPEAANRIAAACAGVPLAVRIAATRLATRPSWPLSHLAEMLRPDTRLDTLATQDTAVRTSISGSYESLSPALQRTFRNVALLGSHDFPSWAASIVLGDAPAEHLVEELRDRSLLHDVSDHTSTPRYVMPDLLRDYASELLRKHSELRSPTRTALEIWVGLTAIADSHVPRNPIFTRLTRWPTAPHPTLEIAERFISPNPQEWLTRERRLLRSAVELGVLNDASELALELAARLDTFLTRHFLEESELMWRCLVGSTDERVRRQASYRVSVILATQHCRFTAAISGLDAHIEWLESSDGSPGELTRALAVRALCERHAGDSDVAWRMIEQALDLATAEKDGQVIVLLRRNLALLMNARGQPARALDEVDGALRIAEGFGEPSPVLAALYTKAQILSGSGRHEEVLDLCRNALDFNTDRIGSKRAAACFSKQMSHAYQAGTAKRSTTT